MPHTKINPADEVIASVLTRIGNRLLQAASSAEPFSALRTCAAMGAVRVHFGHGATVDDLEVAEARELIREINDVLEVAPTSARDALRRTRIDLEELIDRHALQLESKQRLKRMLVSRHERFATLNAQSAPDAKAEG